MEYIHSRQGTIFPLILWGTVLILTVQHVKLRSQCWLHKGSNIKALECVYRYLH